MAKSSTRKLQTIGLLADLDAPLKSQTIKPRDKRQPQLALDPMPARIEPALALLVKMPPSGDNWAYEVKWDGYRLAVHVEPRRSPDHHPWWPRLDIVFSSNCSGSQRARSRNDDPGW